VLRQAAILQLRCGNVNERDASCYVYTGSRVMETRSQDINETSQMAN
jgi:hypothetical protein